MKIFLVFGVLVSRAAGFVGPTGRSFSSRHATGLATTALQVLDPRSLESSMPLLVAVTEGNEWKQYVPLATSSLVLLDIALGRPVANGFAAAVFGKGGESESGPEAMLREATKASATMGSGVDPQKNLNSKARVDIDGVAAEALKRAEDSLLTSKYAEELRPRKGSIEEVRKRLNQQFNDLE